MTTEEEPASDLVTLHSEIDLADGKVFTRGGSPHPLAARVHESLLKAFRGGTEPIREQILEHLSRHDARAAANVILTAVDEGKLGLGKAPALLAATTQIPLDQLDTGLALRLASVRCGLASRSGIFLSTDKDATFLLAHHAYESDEKRVALEMAVALAARERGEIETALAAFRKIASSAEVDAGNRAWAYRNMSLVYSLGSKECDDASRMSADLFLVNGDKRQAAGSMVRAVKSRMISSPQSAVELIDLSLAWLGGDGLLERQMRGGMLRNRARVHFMLNRYEACFSDASASADVLRDLLGSEDDLEQSLGFAVSAGIALKIDVQPLRAELDALARKRDAEGQESRGRLAELVGKFDERTFELLRDSPAVRRDPKLQLIMRTIEAVGRPGVDGASRVAAFERAKVEAERIGAKSWRTILLDGLGLALTNTGEFSRAVDVYREVLAYEPTDQHARQNFASLILKAERYDEAIRWFEDETRRWGPLPGIRYGLGRALFGAGQFERAANELATVALDDNAPEDYRKHAATWRDKAIAEGGRLRPFQRPLENAIARRDVESALADFARFVRQEKRMEFWRRTGTGRGHKWVEQPERLARNLLQSFVAAEFKDAVEAFTELGAGAGRIDLYLRLRGGFAIVVELKMLGAGKSATYAWGGEEQLVHYMENRKSSLGYLIYFDGRTKARAELPDPIPATRRHVITRIPVDVRPVVRDAAE